MEARLTKAQEAMWAENDRLREELRKSETEVRRLTDNMASSEEEGEVCIPCPVVEEKCG